MAQDGRPAGQQPRVPLLDVLHVIAVYRCEEDAAEQVGRVAAEQLPGRGIARDDDPV